MIDNGNHYLNETPVKVLFSKWQSFYSRMLSPKIRGKRNDGNGKTILKPYKPQGNLR